MSEDRVLQVFSEVLGIAEDQLNDDTSPDNTPKWDSVRGMELVSMIEDTFDIQLSTREILKMRTIGIVRDVLREKGVAGV